MRFNIKHLAILAFALTTLTPDRKLNRTFFT